MERAESRVLSKAEDSGRALGFALLASLFVSFAQWQFKDASAGLSLQHPTAALASPALWWGVFSYVVSLYWTLKAYQWGDISFVLPVVSLCNVWNVVLGYFVLGEPLTAARLLGTALILAGIAVLAR
ncbi:EamA family transporter [bacterium]|nr:MAG: EamA family transporter [bacterium]